MKVCSIYLKNFKKFQDHYLDFTDTDLGTPKDLVVLVGDNGSGKSTILQAIAATLGTATRRISSPDKLQWPGFDFSLVNTSWRMPSHVELKVGFSKEELEGTQRCFQKTSLANQPNGTEPSQKRWVILRLNGGNVEGTTAKEYFQFQGRHYAKQIFKQLEEGFNVFEHVGSVFWYHEHRKTTSLTFDEDQDIPSSPIDEDILRRRLSDWQAFHERISRGEYKLRPSQKDFFKFLKEAYAKIFPDRTLDGSVPRSDRDFLADPWFILSHHQKQYEISELSAGERVIFPILLDFAHLNINNSVILIDELELHLHPPLQQALLRALIKLGKNNQIIITTHSQAIVDIVPQNAIIRVES